MKSVLAALSALWLLVGSPLSAAESNWLFRPGKYSNHPATGERIDQFEPLPTLAALPDTRPISSGYRRSLVTQRGADGSSTQYYRVDNFANGHGGIDAEWERVNDVWQRSVLAGGWAAGNANGPGWGGPGWGGGGWNGPGWGGPGWNGPGWGAPGWGGGGWNGGGWNGGGWGGQGWNGPGWNNQGWNGNGWNGPNGGPPQNWQQGGNGPNRWRDDGRANQWNLRQNPDWDGQQMQ